VTETNRLAMVLAHMGDYDSAWDMLNEFIAVAAEQCGFESHHLFSCLLSLARVDKLRCASVMASKDRVCGLRN
jgi:hypothetical protein